jgi:hypothetical protein
MISYIQLQKSCPAFYKCRGSRLVAVMRRTPHLARSFAQRHGAQRWHTSVSALINDDGVDAVYVATPPGSHAAIALQVSCCCNIYVVLLYNDKVVHSFITTVVLISKRTSQLPLHCR